MMTLSIRFGSSRARLRLLRRIIFAELISCRSPFAGLAAYGDRPGSTRRPQFRVLERQAFCPPSLAGEFIEERDIVGAFRRLAHHFVDLVSVRPDEDAPAIGLDACEDDRRSLRRAGQCLITKTLLEVAHEIAQLIVR